MGNISVFIIAIYFNPMGIISLVAVLEEFNVYFHHFFFTVTWNDSKSNQNSILFCIFRHMTSIVVMDFRIAWFFGFGIFARFIINSGFGVVIVCFGIHATIDRVFHFVNNNRIRFSPSTFVRCIISVGMSISYLDYPIVTIGKVAQFSLALHTHGGITFGFNPKDTTMDFTIVQSIVYFSRIPNFHLNFNILTASSHVGEYQIHNQVITFGS